MISLQIPIAEETIRSLNVGVPVLISGRIYTGRDVAHKYLHEGGALPSEINLTNGVLYHCGPVVMQEQGGAWRVTAAGPTTSIREEPYQAEIIRRLKLRAVIGKGGMGEKTLAACQAYGCVYLHAIGGAAQVLAERIQRVTHVFFLKEFGSPEAMWELEVSDFPAVVTMDARGQSLHRDVLAASEAELAKRI